LLEIKGFEGQEAHLDKRQELAINAVKQLFEEVIEKYNLLKEELTAPEVK